MSTFHCGDPARAQSQCVQICSFRAQILVEPHKVHETNQGLVSIVQKKGHQPETQVCLKSYTKQIF